MLLSVVGCIPGVQAAAPTVAAEVSPRSVPLPSEDPFYRYAGTTPLADIAPGTVLKTRTGTLHLATLPLPVATTQLLYRTSDQAGRPLTTVTTVIEPLIRPAVPRLIAYQSFYDSLTAECQPSYVLNGAFDRGVVVTVELPIIANYLMRGYTVTVSDFEGQDPTFATGPRYGRATLDGIRATFRSRAVGLPSSTKVAMLGYSGGAIATEWATELAPRYAPDVNRRLVGSAFGGVLVHPFRNLSYVDGSLAWSGVMPMALIGMARAYRVDLRPYLNDYGLKVYESLRRACIVDGLGRYPGLTWAKLVKPRYANPASVPLFVKIANRLIMGTGGTPTVPLYIRQGTGGVLEGTRGNKPGIGPGDGVMIAGDVRTLARAYCRSGLPVDYAQSVLSHMPYGAQVLVEAAGWIAQRFAGKVPTSTCGRIARGNPVEPIVATS